jgi:hypothetical protein
MANLITSSVTNLLTRDIPIRVPGYASNHAAVVIPASSTKVLLGPMTADELLGIQPLLSSLVAAGVLTVAATVDSETFVL